MYRKMLLEYKKHLRNNGKVFGCFSLSYLVSSFLLLAMLSLWLGPLQKAWGSVSAWGYEVVAESSAQNDPSKELYKLEALATLKAEKKSINVNAYVAPPNSELFNLGKVESGEIVVSERIAEKLHLSIGDLLYADLTVFDEPRQYKVVKILSYLMDLYNIQGNEDFSVAILGDQEIRKTASGFYVHFMQEDDVESYKLANSYRRIHDVKLELMGISNDLRIREWLVIAVWTILSLVCFFFIHKWIIEEIVKYYHGGFNVSDVKKLNAADHLIFIGIPLLLLVAYLAYQTLNRFYSIWMTIVPTAILGMSLMFWTGGRIFGKSNRVR